MPIRNIELTAEQNAFVEEAVKSGRYRDASDVLRDAVRTLQARRRQEELRLQALRTQIDIGIAAIERGEFDEVDDRELDAYLDDLASSP